MFGKLLLIVLTLIGTGAVLLVLRHERIERMHEITRLHEAIDEEAARLRGLRSQVAREITPDRVRELMRRTELSWVPVPAIPGPGAGVGRGPDGLPRSGDADDLSVMALLESGLTPADAIAALSPPPSDAAADIERLAARTPAPSLAGPTPESDAATELALRSGHRPAAWIGVWPPRTEPTVLPPAPDEGSSPSPGTDGGTAAGDATPNADPAAAPTPAPAPVPASPDTPAP
ncbi:MAG: hypothetical protein AB8G96_00700 [Phycisphaerales bacterium]